jgi:hypothetical protein
VIHQLLFRGVATPLDALAVGASRIAGPPDLPADIAWPCIDGRHLPLILQLALTDVAPFPAAAPLRRDGTLYLFAAQSTEWPGDGRSNVRQAVVYAPPGQTLIRQIMPDESRDPDYWDPTLVCALADLRAATAETEHDEDPLAHVLFPTRKESSLHGLVPPEDYVPLLDMRSDYDAQMNWADAAWITWAVPSADLTTMTFDNAIANVWIG